MPKHRHVFLLQSTYEHIVGNRLSKAALVLQRVQSLTRVVAGDESDEVIRLRAKHTVINRTISVAMRHVRRSRGGVKVPASSRRIASGDGKVVTILTESSAVCGQVVVEPISPTMMVCSKPAADESFASALE